MKKESYLKATEIQYEITAINEQLEMLEETKEVEIEKTKGNCTCKEVKKVTQLKQFRRLTLIADSGRNNDFSSERMHENRWGNYLKQELRDEVNGITKQAVELIIRALKARKAELEKQFANLK